VKKTITLILLSFSIIIFYLFFDKEIAYFFHTHITGKTKHIIKLISNFGKAEYYLIPSFIVFLIYRNKNLFIKKASLLVFYSVIISGILVNIIKVIVARYRPPALFKENLYGFHGFDIGFLVNSFPSGHTTTAFSGFVALALVMPKYKYIFILLAIIIALTRIMLSVHYVSDIIAGAMLGTLTTYFLYKKMFKDENEKKL